MSEHYCDQCYAIYLDSYPAMYCQSCDNATKIKGLQDPGKSSETTAAMKNQIKDLQMQLNEMTQRFAKMQTRIDDLVEENNKLSVALFGPEFEDGEDRFENINLK
jgi:hypothetical protein